MAISKTDYIRGLQCQRMLWLDKNRPDKKIIPPEVLERLSAGNDFGDKAMAIFGENFIEVTTYKDDGKLDYRTMIKKTEQLISVEQKIICEASFSYLGNFCSVDILKFNDGYYDVYEVKNSTQIKEVFLNDLAFQIYILNKCGVKTRGYYLILNDGKDGFAIKDVSKDIKSYVYKAGKNIWEFSKIKNSKQEVLVDMGEQCLCPYECWYYEYCKSGIREGQISFGEDFKTEK